VLGNKFEIFQFFVPYQILLDKTTDSDQFVGSDILKQTGLEGTVWLPSLPVSWSSALSPFRNVPYFYHLLVT